MKPADNVEILINDNGSVLLRVNGAPQQMVLHAVQVKLACTRPVRTTIRDPKTGHFVTEFHLCPAPPPT